MPTASKPDAADRVTASGLPLLQKAKAAMLLVLLARWMLPLLLEEGGNSVSSSS